MRAESVLCLPQLLGGNGAVLMLAPSFCEGRGTQEAADVLRAKRRLRGQLRVLMGRGIHGIHSRKG